MKYKKGLSTIVTTIMIIAMVLVAGVIIFTLVRNVAEDNLGKTEACYNLYEKISLNDDYTCYNSTGNYTQFSLNRKELTLDSLRISIDSEIKSEVFLLTEKVETIDGLNNYPDNNTGVSLPGNSSGLTYIANGFTVMPSLIQISPVRGGVNCEVVDEISTFVECL
jgi:flagellin-like protein